MAGPSAKIQDVPGRAQFDGCQRSREASTEPRCRGLERYRCCSVSTGARKPSALFPFEIIDANGATPQIVPSVWRGESESIGDSRFKAKRVCRGHRIGCPGASYYITGRLQNRDAFVDEGFVVSIGSCRCCRSFWMGAKSFVLLPDHYHLILEVPPQSDKYATKRRLQLYNRRPEQRPGLSWPIQGSFSKNLSSYLSLGMPH